MSYQTPELDRLWQIFGDAESVPSAVPIPDDQVPEPYHGLLVHNGHMTETLELTYGGLVRLHVIRQRHDDASYARMLTLSAAATEATVMFGIMQVNLRQTTQAVRDEILAGQTPLGRILVRHNVLRRVQFHQCLFFATSSALSTYITLPTYGRLATIFCDGLPAVELLEIVTGSYPPAPTPPRGGLP